jgi:hypothetical protein
MLETESISALTQFAVDVFRYPPLFALFYYAILALAVVFQTIVFMKFYDKITESAKQQNLSEDEA